MGISVLEDSAIDEALIFGILTLEGDNHTEGGRVREGARAIVCNLDGTFIEVECRGPCLCSVLPSIPKSF